MDHIPLPRDPVRSPPRIQYYCLEEYDRGDFNTYPDRQGWPQEELFTRSTWSNVDGANGRGRRAAAAFLQQWLFFGLLHAAFGDDIAFQDYIDDDNGTKYIQTRNLLSHADQLVSKRDFGLVTANDMHRLDRSLRTAYLAYESIRSEPTPSLDPYFLLSISLLRRFVTCLLHVLFGDDDRMSPSETCMWYPPIVASNTDLLEHEMIEQGWCHRVVNQSRKLLWLEYRYFTSFLSNIQQRQSHRGVCTETQCLASQIQKSSYQTVHSSDNCSCSSKGFEREAVEKVLEAGELPLAAWDCTNGVVKLISGKFDTTYVAISHVWSDGLGNPHANEVPQCQLEVLNDLVQKLYPGEARQIPFWVDTLCCPTGSSNGKLIAIRKMRDTYACANKVLVLDNALRSMETVGRSIAELAFYIRWSNWSSRLWTFQEAVLPMTLVFQFSNEALDSESILSTAMDFNSDFANEWGSSSDLRHIYRSIRGACRHSRQSYEPPTLSLGDCTIALTTRTTSVQEDESLCLASLMSIDPALLLSVSPRDRMMHFWAQLPHVCETWMYYEYSRLDSVGFRWAPKTLLGTGSSRYYSGTSASPTKDGLLVNAYSITLWTLDCPLSHPIADKLWIRGTDGHRGYLISNLPYASPAHGSKYFTAPEGHFSRVALLMSSTISNESMQFYTRFVMVFVTEEHEGVTYARRSDAGIIFDANSPASQGYGVREFLLRAESDRVKMEGGNYLLDNQYTAVVGGWTDEKSKWCID